MSLELPVLRLGLAGFTSEQQQQLGSMLNRAVSGGLAAYAVWCWVRARYEDIERSDG